MRVVSEHGTNTVWMYDRDARVGAGAILEMRVDLWRGNRIDRETVYHIFETVGNSTPETCVVPGDCLFLHGWQILRLIPQTGHVLQHLQPIVSPRGCETRLPCLFAGEDGNACETWVRVYMMRDREKGQEILRCNGCRACFTEMRDYYLHLLPDYVREGTMVDETQVANLMQQLLI